MGVDVKTNLLGPAEEEPAAGLAVGPSVGVDVEDDWPGLAIGLAECVTVGLPLVS
jgi:hypothetical protein